MKFILFLAWRNVVRYRKRTIQSFLILFSGAFCIMLVDAYMKGYAASAAERIIGQAGHLDVHAVGYLESAEAMPLDLVISDADAVINRLLAATAAACSPGVRPLASPSVETGCLLSNGDASRAAPVLATEPFARVRAGAAAAVNPLLADVSGALTAGRFYRDASDGGALLDEKYARRLGLDVGSSLILLGNDAYGSFAIMETPVIGLFRESSLPGEVGCVVDLPAFAAVFGLEGKATAVSLWFASGGAEASAGGGFKLAGSAAETAAVQAAMDAFADDPALEVRPFAKISASYAAIFEFLNFFLAGMMAIFALVSCVGVTNAILLSVQDRVKDIGTLRALVFTARQAGRMVYAETFIVGAAAATAALAVGYGVVAWMQAAGFGIYFELSDLGATLPDRIQPAVFPVRLLVIAALSAVFPLAAAVLPARAARRLTIRESLSER